MGWFVPRNLASIKFGGTQLVPEGDLLPKPTVLLFETKDVSTDASVLPLSSLKLQDFDRPFLECSHYEPCRSGLEAYRKLTAPGALKPAYALKIDATSVKGWNWMPGDALGILCQNDPCVVEYALKRLEIDPNAAYSLTVVGEAPKESFAEFWLNSKRTWIKAEELFRKYLDWSYFPKKACLKDLSSACTDAKDAADLLFLSSRSGSPHYLTVAKERTTILDFLSTFLSCKPSLSLLLSYLPLLHPRYYSIANSPLDSTDTLEIAFTTIEYETPNGLARKGLCSSWLERCLLASDSQQHQLLLELVPRPNYSSFRPPTNPNSPTIMICAGTGISPFIGFLRHWSRLKQIGSKTLRWLFFGFRDSELDYLFKEELKDFLESGVLSRLNLAVSRQPELGHPKYVQHAVEAHSEEIYSLLTTNPSTRVYLCGDELTMIKEVNAAFVGMIEKATGMSQKDSNNLFLEWGKSGRFVRDIWI